MIPFRQIGIFGLGLMGGSLAGALKAAGYAGTVVGHSGNAESIRLARERGWIDAGFSGGAADTARAAEGCDLLVICAPISQIEETVRKAIPGIGEGAVLTDVGSTKAWLTQAIPPILLQQGKNAVYVPSHPMCGSEKSGFSAARPHLYQGANCIVCNDPGVDGGALAKVAALWKSVGSRVVSMASKDHDRWAAKTSHLPHMIASVLADTVGREEISTGLLALIGNGLRDTTRVAEGSPAVWSEIAATNRENILQALDNFSIQLNGFRAALAKAMENGNWSEVESLLAGGVESRRRLVAPAKN